METGTQALNGQGEVKAVAQLMKAGAAPAPRRPGFSVQSKGLAAAAAVVVAVVGGIVLVNQGWVSTDDAAIDGHVVAVSPRVSGQVARVLVDDNQIVKKGDLLVELDPSDYAAQVDVAQAAVDGADAAVTKTALDVKRYENLAARNEASRQTVDHARADAQSARAALESAAARLRLARLNLSYTRITAPQAGRVTRKTAEEGAHVDVGQSLFDIVPTDVWVVANFKETQLRSMRPGQRAEITVDAYPGKLEGKVDSLQAGTGARFSVLPAENATGNFVKVVQRVPVKIVLDQGADSARLLAPGMSVEAEVEVK